MKFGNKLRTVIELLCRVFSLACIVFFAVILMTPAAKYMTGWQFVLLCAFAVLACWVLFMRYFSWHKKLRQLMLLPLENGDGQVRDSTSLSLALLVLSGMGISGLVGIYIWDIRYENFRKQVLAHGYPISLTQLSAQPGSAVKGISSTAGKLDVAEFNNIRGRLREMPFGKMDLTKQQADRVADVYRGFVSKELMPAIKMVRVDEPADYSEEMEQGPYANLPRYAHVAVAAQLLVCMACSESGKGNAAAAWDFVAANLEMADKFAGTFEERNISIAKYIYEQSLSVSIYLLSRNEQEIMPRPIADRLVKVLAYKLADRVTGIAWAHRFALSDYAKRHGTYMKNYVPHDSGVPIWVRLSTDMQMVTMGPLQLEFDDLAGHLLDESRILKGLDELDNQQKKLNFMFNHDFWPQYSQIYYGEFLLRDEIKAVLLVNAVKSYRKEHGRYPENFAQLNLTGFPENVVRSSITGLEFQYAVLPSGHFNVWNAIPESSARKRNSVSLVVEL